jgi:hypothetical protein
MNSEITPENESILVNNKTHKTSSDSVVSKIKKDVVVKNVKKS